MKLSKESLPLSARLEILSNEYSTLVYERLEALQDAVDNGESLQVEQLIDVCELLEASSRAAYETREALKREVWIEAVSFGHGFSA